VETNGEPINGQLLKNCFLIEASGLPEPGLKYSSKVNFPDAFYSKVKAIRKRGSAASLGSLRDRSEHE
jgi:hypothetical protein